jgi:hypothetical protein
VTADSIQAFLLPIVDAMNGAGIPHMLVGSFASMLHGELRATHDLDLVIDPTREQLDGLSGGCRKIASTSTAMSRAKRFVCAACST